MKGNQTLARICSCSKLQFHTEHKFHKLKFFQNKNIVIIIAHYFFCFLLVAVCTPHAEYCALFGGVRAATSILNSELSLQNLNVKIYITKMT